MRAVKHTKQNSASNWFSKLPLEEQGFTLMKSEFRDALALRSAKDIRGLPSKCPCDETFNINYAMNYKRGGFVTMCHNNIRDFEANLLKNVCVDVETEPQLQPLDGKNIIGITGVKLKTRPESTRYMATWTKFIF